MSSLARALARVTLLGSLIYRAHCGRSADLCVLEEEEEDAGHSETSLVQIKASVKSGNERWHDWRGQWGQSRDWLGQMSSGSEPGTMGQAGRMVVSESSLQTPDQA